MVMQAKFRLAWVHDKHAGCEIIFVAYLNFKTLQNLIKHVNTPSTYYLQRLRLNPLLL